MAEESELAQGGREADSIFSLLFCSGLWQIGWCPHTGKGRSLLIQMLISSGTILRNTHKWCLSDLWAPRSLVKLVHKINHHTLEKLMAYPQKNGISRSVCSPACKAWRNHCLAFVDCLVPKHGISQGPEFACYFSGAVIEGSTGFSIASYTK